MCVCMDLYEFSVMACSRESSRVDVAAFVYWLAGFSSSNDYYARLCAICKKGYAVLKKACN